jgi:hypothetical protein
MMELTLEETESHQVGPCEDHASLLRSSLLATILAKGDTAVFYHPLYQA